MSKKPNMDEAEYSKEQMQRLLHSSRAKIATVQLWYFLDGKDWQQATPISIVGKLGRSCESVLVRGPLIQNDSNLPKALMVVAVTDAEGRMITWSSPDIDVPAGETFKLELRVGSGK